MTMHKQMERLYTAAQLKGIHSQSDLAKALNASSQTVNNWEARGMSKQGMLDAERLIGCSAIWLETGTGNMWSTGSPSHGVHENHAPYLVDAKHPDDAPRTDVVFVHESRIEFSAGNGSTARYELIEDEEPATYRLSWFQKYGINPKRVRRFRVSGDSMEPMLYARDTILVNMDETNVVDGKLYAIRYGDDLRVKYLSRRLDGTLTLRSVNPAYKNEEIPPEMVAEHITVIGRVRDTSGTGGL